MSIPKQIKPQLARDNPYKEPFKQPDFILQEKFDGTRVIAIKQKNRWHLMTRSWENELSSRFPEIIKDLSRIPSDDVILDGELTFAKEGKIIFTTALAKPTTKRGLDVKLMLFDVLKYNRDVTHLPLLERLTLLDTIVPRGLKYVGVVKTHHNPEHFSKTYNAIIKGKGEGVVLKKKAAPYAYDSREHWIKVKKEYTEDCVVIGMTHGTGIREATFGALILAQYDRKGNLKAVGKTSGFDNVTMHKLYSMLMRMPAHAPYEGIVVKGVKKWVSPKIVVEVKYMEKTPYGILRHPAFLRIRDDKVPSQAKIQYR